jgi:hypothetical protein
MILIVRRTGGRQQGLQRARPQVERGHERADAAEASGQARPSVVPGM